jgi:hypothetical protein
MEKRYLPQIDKRMRMAPKRATWTQVKDTFGDWEGVENWCWDETLGDLVPARRIYFAVKHAR